MWNKPWTYKEGTAVAVGLAATGLLLQLTIGPLEWRTFLWPANLVALLLLVCLLLFLHVGREKIYFARFMATPQMAVPVLVAVTIVTVVMGFTRQVSSNVEPTDPLGLSKMLQCWPFVLEYVLMTMVIGMTTLKQISAFKVQRIPSLMCHVGLFVFLTCGTLGNADMQRLKMFCENGKPEWRGLDENQNVVELPLAVQLNKFDIKEYAPKLMLVNDSGRALPIEKPATMTAGLNAKGQLMDWQVEVTQYMEDAMPVALDNMARNMQGEMSQMIRMDSLGSLLSKDGYRPSNTPGAATVVRVKATRGKEVKEGWVSTGSYRFSGPTLQLTPEVRLAMSTREPERFSSDVDIFTQDGNARKAVITVNNPVTVEGWKIYQYSYNEQMGKWSTYSVLELVRDPWLPAVYTGLYLILAGAVGIFLSANRRKEK